LILSLKGKAVQLLFAALLGRKEIVLGCLKLYKTKPIVSIRSAVITSKGDRTMPTQEDWKEYELYLALLEEQYKEEILEGLYSREMERNQ